MTDVTSITKEMFSPVHNRKIWFFTYTKVTQNDTMDLSSYFDSIEGVFARDGTAGADDKTTWSSTTVTFAGTPTGAGWMIVVGTGA